MDEMKVGEFPMTDASADDMSVGSSSAATILVLNALLLLCFRQREGQLTIKFLLTAENIYL